MRKLRFQWIPTLLVLGSLLLGSFAWAEEGDETASPAPSSKASSKSLADRVKELETKLDSAEEKFKQIHEDQLRLHFNLYGDAEYRLFGPAANFAQSNGFYIGQTDLHIMAQYGPHLG